MSTTLYPPIKNGHESRKNDKYEIWLQTYVLIDGQSAGKGDLFIMENQNILWLKNQLNQKYQNNTLEIVSCGGTYQSPCEVVCKVCGYHHIFSKASNLLYKARTNYACPDCEREAKKKPIIETEYMKNLKVKTTDDMEERLNRDFKHNSLKVLEFGGNLRSPLTVCCSVCGFKHTYPQAQFLLYKKNKEESCPVCAGPNKKRITIEEAQQRLDDKFGKGEFTLQKFSKASEKMLIKHEKCGFCFTKKTLFDATKMMGCPKCEQYRSKGEKEIAAILLKLKVPFETEKRFPGLIGESARGPLRFDFCISFEDKTLLIEFDGPQHFESGLFKTEDCQLEIQQKNDKKKNEFCSQNNYPLLRIPYWDFKNLKSIIKEFLILNDYPLGE